MGVEAAYAYQAGLLLLGVAVLYLILSEKKSPEKSKLASGAGVLTLKGVGTVFAVPDLASVSLTISNTTETARDSQANTATITKDVIEALTEIDSVAPQHISTTSISVHPQLDRDKTGKTRTTGYKCTNSISVKIVGASTKTVSLVLDKAISVGGDSVSIGGVSFGLSDEVNKEKKAAARVAAAKNAVNKAKEYTQALNIELGSIAEITEKSEHLSGTSASRTLYGVGQDDDEGDFDGSPAIQAMAAPGSKNTPISAAVQKVKAELHIRYHVME